jgi:hypothetical protein
MNISNRIDVWGHSFNFIAGIALMVTHINLPCVIVGMGACLWETIFAFIIRGRPKEEK